MLHHFTLTFRLPESTAVSAQSVANEIPGSDFTVEGLGSDPSWEFSVHFSREGANATEVLEYAKSQVQRAFPDAQLVGMDLSEEPPMQGIVDDITKLVIHACKKVGSVEAAQSWLATPNTELGGLTPKALMVDAEGRMRVSRLLSRMAKEQGSHSA